MDSLVLELYETLKISVNKFIDILLACYRASIDTTISGLATFHTKRTTLLFGAKVIPQCH